jgi:hypothetical protein
MSHPAWIDDIIADAKKLFTHSDPAVPAAAQSIVDKLEAAKTEIVADAEKLGSEAVADGKGLLTEAEQDAAAVVGQATGATPAAPAKP